MERERSYGIERERLGHREGGVARDVGEGKQILVVEGLDYKSGSSG